MSRKSNNVYNKWLRNTLTTIIGIMLGIIFIQVLVDPYFHYHKPITKYRLNDERYINDGIARHFDYDAIITGNSLCQNFSTSQYDELFGTSSVKLPYSGAGYKEIWESLGRALEYNDGVKEVLVCMDLQDLDREADWERYEGNPTYLYDDNVFNDIKYIFNKDAIYRGALYNLIWTVTGHESTSMDEYSSWERETGPEVACASLQIIPNDVDPDGWSYDDEDEERVRNNVYSNIIPVIEKYPQVEFKIVVPPSSVARWAEYCLNNQVEYRIDGLEYALGELILLPNVEIYAFDDAYDVTTNLDLYSDTIHYNASINEWMLKSVYNGGHYLDNTLFLEYFDGIRKFYLEYDYSLLNRYIEQDS